MSKKLLILSTGFALFSMFFGSGNLVFPVVVGLKSDGHTWLAFAGILFTGVIIPFLGVFGMMLYGGDLNRFFRMFGKKGVFLFSLLALGLIGPFGVLARCLTVAHGALLFVFPNAWLPLTSVVLCLVIYVLSVNKNNIVAILGNVLTPVLLVSIALIAFFGLVGQPVEEPVEFGGLDALMNGFFQGYHMMDLIAAFFFAQFVLNLCDKRTFCFSALIGASLLAAVYVALVLLGSTYALKLHEVAPQEMLGVIALESLGSFAAPCVCVAMIFACLTTMIALASLFAEFLKTEVTKDRISSEQSLIITLVISFFVSTLDFAGIASFLGPILEKLYPVLIAITLFNIMSVIAYGKPHQLELEKKCAN